MPLPVLQRTFACLALLILATAAAGNDDTASGHPDTPRVSIIIDDIGYRLQDDRRAVSLPGPIGYAILPHSPHAVRMAKLAFSLNKDVLVHQPMEAQNGNHLLGPGALTRAMGESDFRQTVHHNIESVPHAIGISNHMGSLLTSDERAMRWLMQTMQASGLFYMDSMTSAASVAGKSAQEYRIPYLRRDVFLDNEIDYQAIRRQFDRLIRIAREKGSAIGIGHPHPQTIATLAQLLPRLRKEGVALVSIREILEYRHREEFSWQQSSLSPWPRDVRN